MLRNALINTKMSKLLRNIHENLEVTNKNASENSFKVCGNYEYYHYVCDGFDDRGWGCGYRTLQTICSWLNYNSQRSRDIPTIREIQETLVQIGDKPNSFIDSKQWIGSVEVGYVIDQLYDVPCKILHLTSGVELNNVVGVLKDHFEKFGSPVMMGGDMDCSSKGVIGVHIGIAAAHLLIVDPHYFGKEQSTAFLQNKGWVKWQPLSDFLSTSFYNLCLPQVRSKVMQSK